MQTLHIDVEHQVILSALARAQTFADETGRAHAVVSQFDRLDVIPLRDSLSNERILEIIRP